MHETSISDTKTKKENVGGNRPLTSRKKKHEKSWKNTYTKNFKGIIKSYRMLGRNVGNNRLSAIAQSGKKPTFNINLMKKETCETNWNENGYKNLIEQT